MATFTVSNLNDTGAGSLRAAIIAANADTSGTPVSINFSVAGSINLASALPTITHNVQIHAETAHAAGGAASPTITLNLLGNAGLVFGQGSAGSGIYGIAIGHASGNGITLIASNITVDKCYIGLAANGTALGNSANGLYITATSLNNKIGLNDASISGVVGNVISGNTLSGIVIDGSSGNALQANHIGTSVDGNLAVGNGLAGIRVTNGAFNNTIGGTAFVDTATGQVNNPTGNKGTVAPTIVVPPQGNLISGNQGDGILIDTQSQNNTMYGNFIGTVASGNAALGNGGNGVHILNANGNSLIGCQFVNNPFVYYNVISGNTLNGLQVTNSDNVTVQGNFFGTGANNAVVVGNGKNGIQVDGTSNNTVVGGVIPLGNVSAGNGANGIYVTDKASNFTTFNTFGGLFAFQGAAANQQNGLLIDSTGGGQTVRTNVFSGNTENGIKIAGNASGVIVDPNIAGLDTVGNAPLANGRDGLAITDTAHNITVGGNTQSVIPQNTFSGNAGYGIGLYGQTYNVTVVNTAVGLGATKTTALGNQSGGILYATSGSGNVIGGLTTDPHNPQTNYISGNNGNGITLLYGTTGAQIISNVIGADRFGIYSLPNQGQAIALDGSLANTIQMNTGGNSSAIELGLPAQSAYAQLEALYTGYFGRAGDVPGTQYWMKDALSGLISQKTLTSVMKSISERFAASPENAPYAVLATQPLDPNNTQQVGLAQSFINQTYRNLFNRTADAAGEAYWLSQLFTGKVAFGDLVYNIASSAAGQDIAVENYKITAATYYTQNVSANNTSAGTLAASQNAVRGVSDLTSELSSVNATNRLTGSTVSERVESSIFNATFVTGVRGDYNGNVVLTGNTTIPNSSNTQAMLYQGPMSDTALGKVYALNPGFANVVSSTFYGPNTSVFDTTLAIGQVRAVGSYVTSSDGAVRNHGMMYQGAIDGVGGTWTAIDVPSSLVGGQTVANTIVHSTMGDFAVGNYDISGVPGSGNAFIYNIKTGQYTIFNQGFGGTNQLTTAYGIWQNSPGSTHYTVVGGSNHGLGVNQAYVADYNSVTGVFSNIKYYSYKGNPNLVTHFDGITAIAGGFNLMGIGDFGSALATITLNTDGTFSDAVWTQANMDGATLTTGNSVYQNYTMGIYVVDGTSGVNTYSQVIDQSYVDARGGLIMPVGAANFSYATSVAQSVGALVVGSQTAGNVLGGSMGNDLIIGNTTNNLADTIYTGGGSDQITLSTAHTATNHIELYAGITISAATPVAPGGVVNAIAGSVVDAADVPQLGWWGQATGQRGGAVSNATTNLGFGTGTSLDMVTVTNFQTGTLASPVDTLDFSLASYSGLLRSVNPNAAPTLGNAVFSNTLSLGGTVTTSNADVLVIGGGTSFANAAALASQLAKSQTAITFAVSQTKAVNHYLVAYQDTSGNARIADMDIHSATAFTNTSQGSTLAISDLVVLTGVTVNQLNAGNIHFVA